MRVNPALDQVGAHPIAAIHQRARDLRAAGHPLVDFSIGDPREPTWDRIRRTVQEAVPVVSQYPTTAGLPGLRRAIADYIGRRLGVAVDPDRQVMPTSGSKEAIFSTALAFIDRNRGDVVGFPDPGYPVYERGAVLAGASAVAVEANETFVTTAADVPDEKWRHMAMLWVCTPSNPTGAVTPVADLSGLVTACRTHDTLLCSDECYLDVYEPGSEVPGSVLQAAGDGAEGVLAYLSLSKRSGMTGYRSGAIVGDAAAIERITRLRTATGTAAPEFVQMGAIEAWNDDAHVEERREIFSAKRSVLRRVFESQNMPVAASRAGVYLWVEVGGDDLKMTNRLLDAGIVVSPGRIFGSRGRGYIRLALVPTLSECRQAAEQLAELL